MDWWTMSLAIKARNDWRPGRATLSGNAALIVTFSSWKSLLTTMLNLRFNRYQTLNSYFASIPVKAILASACDNRHDAID